MSQSHAPLAGILLLRESELVWGLSFDFSLCPSLRDQALAILKRLVVDESRGCSGSVFMARPGRVDMFMLFERPAENLTDVAQLIDAVAGEIGFEPQISTREVNANDIGIMRELVARHTNG